jgi:hypothetical protein
MPQIIDLVLGLDIDEQRDHLGEPGVGGPTVEHHQLLAAQLDRGGEDRPVVRSAA